MKTKIKNTPSKIYGVTKEARQHMKQIDDEYIPQECSFACALGLAFLGAIAFSIFWFLVKGVR